MNKANGSGKPESTRQAEGCIYALIIAFGSGCLGLALGIAIASAMLK